MEAFLVSTGVVALAEFGDKSQLVVLALASRFREPIPIILGMLAATILNHIAAAAAGAWLNAAISPQSMRWILGLSFIGIAIWTLIPGKRQEQEQTRASSRFGVFGTTLCAFFLMEMGDKTQIATIALAAKYGSPFAVIAGSTLGIMLADVPVVIFGASAERHLPGYAVHRIAPAIFLLLGIIALRGVIR
jgi:putative Ca2+/H+ antiporter (TMEM165/GDT1 family)